MKIRVHADQTGDADGARLAAELGARSADHLDTPATKVSLRWRRPARSASSFRP
jgi:hypothetical protein